MCRLQSLQAEFLRPGYVQGSAATVNIFSQKFYILLLNPELKLS